MAPPEVEWSDLSPAAREIATRISYRETLGYSYAEIKVFLEAERSDFKHLHPPPERPITTSWISTQVRRLRDEILAQGERPG